MKKSKIIQSQKDLQKIQKESLEQALPQQRRVLSASDKIKRKTSNLPDPAHSPIGWKDGKGYDHIYPWIHIPRIHPLNSGDTVIFNNPNSPANQLILGDNLEVLRILPSECIDLIYIDPPFFSGRTYNMIWGDTNEVRTFYDIWESGIDSYLVWFNARLWEMRRVLKKTGSIYVHCDWHASHYIKTEMDKIFGYENFQREIIWDIAVLSGFKTQANNWIRGHDVIFCYTKSNNFVFNKQFTAHREEYIARFNKINKEGRKYFSGRGERRYLDEVVAKGKSIGDVWSDIMSFQQIPTSKEKIGYPTQKPEKLLERIIKASSNEGDVVADFFCGGGTTLAVAMKNKRRFIGCDSSRVAISVTLDRLVKVGEDMSGVMSNVAAENKAMQLGLAHKERTLKAKIPNIEVSYLGVYPIDKFESFPQDNFIDFVLTCYGASRNTAEGITDGYRPPSQSEPILIGPSSSKKSVEGETIKKFFDEIKSRLEPNKLVNAKIIGWRFSRQVVKYIKILEDYIERNNLPVKLELIPLDSKEFRSRILQRYPDVSEAEFFLRFSKAPVVGDIKVKKVGDLEYEFEAIDTFSTNEDGWLVNCQWDFDYQTGHFCADKNHILSREKTKDKKRGELFKAILKAKHKFEKLGEWSIACKVQDNLAGETILSKKIEIK
ncbi:site-specific DNA-methyltransferase [Candidatus Parcubacteria bacterium]|nr:site-specific DNA-methyltransferase [Candidatus Parcubacteria bacterium]